MHIHVESPIQEKPRTLQVRGLFDLPESKTSGQSWEVEDFLPTLPPWNIDAPPPPLPAQGVVDLLKHPMCVGQARTLVLAQLSRHYKRPFADQWELVAYAEANKLPLDLASPWRPPAP